MSLLFRLLVSAGMLAFGLLVLAKTEPFVRLIGKNAFGERFFGAGGTYTLWKLVGVLLAFGAIVILFWR